MTKDSEKILKNAISEAVKCTREKLQESKMLQIELSKQRREARKKAKADEKAKIEAEEKARFEKGFQIDTDEIRLGTNQIENLAPSLSEIEWFFESPIQKKIDDYKFAAAISFEIFADSKGQNKLVYFDSYLKECKKRIRDKTSERHTGLPTVKLGVQDFEMILKTLTEDGYIQVKKTRNKSPYDLVYTI